MAKVQFNCRLEESVAKYIADEAERQECSQADLITIWAKRASGLAVEPRPRKLSKRAAKAEALRASDPMASERPEIDYAAADEVPSGGSVAVVGAAKPVAKATVRTHNFHSGTRPIAGCPQCQELVK